MILVIDTDLYWLYKPGKQNKNSSLLWPHHRATQKIKSALVYFETLIYGIVRLITVLYNNVHAIKKVCVVTSTI